MSRYIFLFDLDSTIMKGEILISISKKMGIYEEMRLLTDCSARGEVPFKQNFLTRIELLKGFSVAEMCNMVSELETNKLLLDFIRQHQERCYVVTSNPDILLDEFIEKNFIRQNVFCSKAQVKDDHIQDMLSVVNKNAVIKQIGLPFVAVGAGNDDSEMIESAEVGIGYGGVHDIAPAVLESASHVVYNEKRLVDFLDKLL